MNKEMAQEKAIDSFVNRIDSGDFVCKICNKPYRSEKTLRSHIALHDDQVSAATSAIYIEFLLKKKEYYKELIQKGWFERIGKRYDSVKAAFIVAVEGDPVYAIEWCTGDIVNVCIEYRLAREVQIYIEEKDLDSTDRPVEVVIATLQKEILRNKEELFEHRISRSTNPIANEIDNIKFERSCRFFNEGIKELISYLKTFSEINY